MIKPEDCLWARNGHAQCQSAQQDEFQQVGRAISYDGGKTPYCLWYEGDGDLLDLEVRRLGGTASKMPLFAKVQK